jgi:hypothetical protein
MPIHQPTLETFTFIARVEETYASLMQFASARGLENLGGILLFAGEFPEPGRTLAVAGNIAGAATLTASTDPAAQKQALREGAADFLVTNLDEALRILKNEIRKREPVAVAVSIPPETILKEMLGRGVLPDLLPPLPSSPAQHSLSAFIAQGAQLIEAPPPRPASKLHIWPIPSEYTQRPAAFDALLLEQLPLPDHAARRWLRLSPRYLSPEARRLRSLRCDGETASKLIALVGPPLQP